MDVEKVLMCSIIVCIEWYFIAVDDISDVHRQPIGSHSVISLGHFLMYRYTVI